MRDMHQLALVYSFFLIIKSILACLLVDFAYNRLIPLGCFTVNKEVIGMWIDQNADIPLLCILYIGILGPIDAYIS